MSPASGTRRSFRSLGKQGWRTLRLFPERWLVRLASHVLPRLPRSWILALSRAGGALYVRLARRDRAIMLANLDLALGPPVFARERNRLLQSIGTHAARMLLDAFWFSRDSRRRILDYVSLDPEFEAWTRSTHAAVAVTGHLGSWELVAQALSLHGRKGTSVYSPIGGSETQRRLLAMRRQHGQALVPREGAMVPLLRALRRGELVGLLLDQRTPVRDGGTFVEFMGLKTTMSKAAGVLSVRLHVPVVAFCCRHVGRGCYRAEVLGALPADHGLDEQGVTQWVADSLADAIRETPEQWLWMYRRWRHVPEGEDPGRYPFYAKPHNPEHD